MIFNFVMVGKVLHEVLPFMCGNTGSNEAEIRKIVIVQVNVQAKTFVPSS